MKKSKIKILFIILAGLIFSACQSEPAELSSSFNDTPQCVAHLQNIVEKNFNLRDIAKQDLRFDVRAESMEQETISFYIPPFQSDDLGAEESAGRILVDKVSQEMHNSTFEGVHMLPVRYDEQAQFFAQCF